jgi:hypothetical protein
VPSASLGVKGNSLSKRDRNPCLVGASSLMVKKKKKEGKISNILGDDDDSLCEEI